ncbi:MULTISPECIES: thioredoxin [Thalassospira]|jgi:putative thioredoxin|uniref:Thioredoxin n=2 Tax=Thalassospira TaxID=168934 RepID=A0A367VH88_9PROT|nr:MULTISPECIES: thioredoxin [Thalassospira]MBR9898962.1 thioredoxin [Rhodospirillales bacterium]MBO6806371.1 thioredoxin [Thalassospira sp.]MBO6839107.1 thioredoxin [Thalassospira sp.]MBS8275147.1 thioredoxin [Thalassospira tepidiphila]RCK24369.1 thioredoxin [Thalassospira profundimaris]|tara:strand:+ start:916 stop:1842 length:927 start_codon:yes stop_codon:yes gene_type:complete
MSIILDANAPDGATSQNQDSDLIKDSSVETFVQDVIEPSMEVPVVVDFWAPWCGPCKNLTPIIEKVTREAGGRVKLVKVNIDENQELAMQLRIQSVPTVYAFKGGRPVDGFQGGQPESEVRAFYEKLAGGPIESPIEGLLEQASAELAEENFEAAHGIYVSILEREQENEDAIGGMIRCMVGMDEVEEARHFVDNMSDTDRLKAPIAAAISALELAETGVSGEDLDAARAKAEANPNDPQAQFDYGMACFAKNKREEAVNAMITIIRNNREWNEDAGRTQLLKFFEAWGPMDPASVAGRRALSTVLFS